MKEFKGKDGCWYRWRDGYLEKEVIINKKFPVWRYAAISDDIWELAKAARDDTTTIVDLPMTTVSKWLLTKFRLVLDEYKKPILEWFSANKWEPVPNRGLFYSEQVNAVVEAAYYAGRKSVDGR